MTGLENLQTQHRPQRAEAAEQEATTATATRTSQNNTILFNDKNKALYERYQLCYISPPCSAKQCMPIFRQSLFKHGKPSVEPKLKTKTNYNCFTRLPCGNQIYQLPS